MNKQKAFRANEKEVKMLEEIKDMLYVRTDNEALKIALKIAYKKINEDIENNTFNPIDYWNNK